ncbi:MAG: ZIP family metal transporter [Rhodothalassiaceae bacterium]
MSAFLLALTAALCAAGFNAAGLLAVYRLQRWAQARTGLFLGFSAGVLLAALGLHMIPEVLAHGLHPLGFLLAGFAGLWGLERLFKQVSRDWFNHRRHGLVALSAICLHSLADGAVYAFSFQHSLITGALSAAGLVAHEFPEAVVAYMLLRDDGVESRRALGYGFLLTGATTPLGLLIAYPIGLTAQAVTSLTALAAGAISFVLICHLMPSLRSSGGARLTFLAGLALSGGVITALGH